MDPMMNTYTRRFILGALLAAQTTRQPTGMEIRRQALDGLRDVEPEERCVFDARTIEINVGAFFAIRAGVAHFEGCGGDGATRAGTGPW